MEHEPLPSSKVFFGIIYLLLLFEVYLLLITDLVPEPLPPMNADADLHEFTSTANA
jgi:hypothetical protein